MSSSKLKLIKLEKILQCKVQNLPLTVDGCSLGVADSRDGVDASVAVREGSHSTRVDVVGQQIIHVLVLLPLATKHVQFPIRGIEQHRVSSS